MEKKNAWNQSSLKLLLVMLFVVCTVVTILTAPTSSLADYGLDTIPEKLKFRKTNDECTDEKILQWLESLEAIRSLLEKKNMQLRLGFLGLEPDFREWKKFSNVRPTVFKFDHVHYSLTWSDFFPDGIDEGEKPSCPLLPLPSVPKDAKLDLVIARMPCTGSNWERDTEHLQVLLSAAKVAVQTGDQNMYVVLCGRCKPFVNLFTCKELIDHHDNLWLYKVDLRKMQKSLALPVGACELSVPMKLEGSQADEFNAEKEAYVTILHSAESYVCGAITLAQSIRLSGSTRGMVILVDKNISPQHRQGLEAAGWKVYPIERIRNPNAEPESYNEWNYSKFRLWQLVQYDRIIFLDADLLVLRNLDFLFKMPEISATINNGSLFNSGVLVIEPSNCTFELFMENIDIIYSYNGGDQGFLNDVFTWWHRLPKHMNFLKHMNYALDLFAADPPVLYAAHFLGIKPWHCFRDYDCNWNREEMHIYASDAAHSQWWKVHDLMPDHLQKFCLLGSRAKASREYDRRQAENAAYQDGHWKIKVKDPRLEICYEDFCNWESMLSHWGEKASAQPTV